MIAVQGPASAAGPRRRRTCRRTWTTCPGGTRISAPRRCVSAAPATPASTATNCCPRWDDAAPLWDALVEAAAAVHGRPAGLGARDTLRTEMGYPLHGQDLSPTISPVQARAGWAVGWRKPAFFGRDALLAERADGPARQLRGLVATGRGVPRPHQNVLTADGTVVGETTSGTFSPTLGLRHRAGADRHRGGSGRRRRGRRSTSAAARFPPVSPSHRSWNCTPVDVDAPSIG